MLTDLPQTVGDFDLGARVGSGGIAVVVRATHRPSGRVVAVKLFERRLFDRMHHSARFLAEARAMSRLRHPRIARVYGAGREDDWYWYAMRYLPDGSVHERVTQHGAEREDRALSLAHDVLEGLVVVHEAGMMHRDVKPQNVMLDGGRAMLVDFGLARHPAGTVPYRTRSDTGMGTPGFVAPEQRIDASRVDGRADVFSTGSLLVYLVTGEQPVALALPDKQRRAFLLGKVPESLAPIVTCATAFPPEDRYPTAVAMREAVNEPGPRCARTGMVAEDSVHDRGLVRY
ncbi:MAG: serine/threonine protein kinase [Myxococcota bacterium]|jgi:serine/threonine protein kinase